MFVKLLFPPRLPVEAIRPATMFGDEQLMIGSDSYAIERVTLEPNDAVVEMVVLRHGAEEYAVAATRNGEHSCSCPDFEFRSARELKPCKHIAAVYLTALFVKSPPKYIQPEVSNGPATTTATTTARPGKAQGS